MLEAWRAKNISSALDKAFFIGKEAISVEKDLSSLKPFSLLKDHREFTFMEILKDSPGKGSLVYPLKSRRLKMLRNLDKRYQGFAILNGNEVVGDLWCCTPQTGLREMNHPDLAWLGLRLHEKEAYLFDLYVKPEERGKGLVNLFLWKTLNALKDRGVTKVYGYYLTDNLPALWVHRMMGYKELKRVRRRRWIPFLPKFRDSRGDPMAS